MILNWLALPFTLLSLKVQDSNIWNLVKVGWGKDNLNHQVLEDGSLKVFYPSNSYSPSKFPQGGIGFYSSPKDIFPCNEVVFSYEVKFDETFDPVLGGKLPGLFLSESTDLKDLNNSSGGKHNNDTASIRIAWRKDFDAEAYVYLPKNQLQEYKNTDKYVKNDMYGDSLWRGLFKFNKNEWNTINIKVKTNTFDENHNGNNDGVLELTINGIQQKFDKLLWSNNPNVKITAILFSTFFGGSKLKYATPVDTWSYFRNLKISN